MAERAWQLVQPCWDNDTTKRWPIAKIVEELEHLVPLPDLRAGDVQAGMAIATFGLNPVTEPAAPEPLVHLYFGDFVNLDGEIEVNKHPVAAGGFADVFYGKLRTKKTEVAVKSFRGFTSSDAKYIDKGLKLISRELRIWQKLRHPNILPFLGITFDLDPNGLIPQAVSPWMNNGPLVHYLKTNPGASHRRLDILFQIASGMEYLHDNAVVHGDLKSNNVLIDNEGMAKLADFGLSRVLVDATLSRRLTVHSFQTSSRLERGTLRWMSPERLSIPIGSDSTSKREPAAKPETFTKTVDIYAYGMVALEVVTEDIPFNQYRSEVQVILALARDERPSRPPNMKDWLWDLIQLCWDTDPQVRPSSSEILEKIQLVKHQMNALMI